MKSFLSLLALSIAPFASAATISYTFEGNNNNATNTGTGFSVGAFTEGGTLSTGSIYGGFTGATAPLNTTTVRAYLPSNVANQSSPSISSHTTYVEFTVTPTVGQTLDFSSANFLFTLGAATGISANNDMPAYAQAGYRINSGAFTALGSVLPSIAPVYSASAPNWASNGASGGFATGVNFDVVQNSANLSLSSITGLNPNDSVTFRIAIGDNSTIGNALTASTGVWKTVYVDDIGISGFNVVPEPTAASLALIGLGIAAFRRKR